MLRYLISCLFILAVVLTAGTFFFRDYWEHRFDELITQQARIYRIDEKLVWSLIYEETYFRSASVGDAGEILWSRSADPALGRSLAASQVVADFRARPLSLSGQYEAEVGGEPRTVLVQVAPVGEAGWAVVAQRPLTAAFGAVDRMVVSTAASALLLIALALVVAALFANRLSRPIDRLAEQNPDDDALNDLADNPDPDTAQDIADAANAAKAGEAPDDSDDNAEGDTTAEDATNDTADDTAVTATN